MLIGGFTNAWTLRLLKGVLITLQYHHRAAEGRLHSGEGN